MHKQSLLVSLILLALIGTACAPAAPAAAPVAAPTEAAAQPTTAAAAPAAPAAGAELKIGMLAATTGAFAGLGQDMIDGANLWLDENGGKIAGRPVKLIVEDSQLDPDIAIEKARALVNRDGVNLVIGPLSGGEGLAVKQAAGEWPNTTFFTIAAANEITMKTIAPNVYRPAFAGGQPEYALAEWALKNNIKKIVTIGEDYAFPWDQIGGFAYVYCKQGGKIPKAYWTPIGTADYSSIITELKGLNADAVFIAYGGADAVNFTKQLNDFGMIGKIKILAGSSFGDASTLSQVGQLLDGTMSGSIYSGTLPYPEFKAFNEKFKTKNGRDSTLFAEGMYEALQIISQAAVAVNGNIEDQTAFRAAVDKVKVNTPRGPVAFDQYHNAVANMYLNKVTKIGDAWVNDLQETFPAVTQYWTYTPEEFNAALPFGRDNPKCP
jgi:branched-chain amino acid transport system substrate-binding protein